MDPRALHNLHLRLERSMTHSMVEYVKAARSLTFLVKAVDLTIESLYAGPALERAIWRYEALWLPILAALHNPPSSAASTAVTKQEQPRWKQHAFRTRVDEIRAKNFANGGLWLRKEKLVPPIDIAWVWYCHRLNPEAYNEDIKLFVEEDDEDGIAAMVEACHTTIETAFKFSDGEDSQSRSTRRLWDILYPFETFMPKYLISHTFDEELLRKRQHITSYTNEISRSSFRSVLTYDLQRAANLQKAFLYQLTGAEVADDEQHGELYETTKYLSRAYKRYLQFLWLHERNPDIFLVPMMDINIMWHMHLACTEEYEKDCMAIVGRVVKHDNIAVDELRKEEIQRMKEEEGDTGNDDELEEDELEELLEKRRRGVSIKETKELWENLYGAPPRYDLEDTRYRGEPPGERGGFDELFQAVNGATRDIAWTESLARILLAVIVFSAGTAVFGMAFWRMMMRHGKFVLGLPLGGAIMGLGVVIFLKIPISRPLSSDSRYWLERAYRQSHNPLPPYLVATSKKSL